MNDDLDEMDSQIEASDFGLQFKDYVLDEAHFMSVDPISYTKVFFPPIINLF